MLVSNPEFVEGHRLFAPKNRRNYSSFVSLWLGVLLTFAAKSEKK